MRITLPSGTPAELAKPSTGTATVGLVLLPDIMGLRPLFDDLATRLAETRDGWSAPRAVRRPRAPGAGRTPAQVGELDDEVIWATRWPPPTPPGAEQVGVLGFCMGGMYTLKASGTGRFAEAVSFYGMIHVPEQWQSDTQGEPLAPAQADGGLPVMADRRHRGPVDARRDVAELEAVGATVVRYEGADHGFVHDPDRPAHRPEDAADAWERALAFLSERSGS